MITYEADRLALGAHDAPRDGVSRLYAYLPLLFAAALLAIAPLLHAEFVSRLPYPPGLDQDAYLAGGRDVVQKFVFMEGRPLYTAWMGIMYVVSGNDLKACFYLEKTVSVLLLAFLMALLGLRLFGARTAVLMGLWTLCCKYVALEPNGSHAFAASLLVASVLCFYLPIRAARLPASLLLLFAATLVRPEMKVPFLFIVAYLMFRLARSRFQKTEPSARKSLDEKRLTYWVAAGAVALSLSALFTLRVGPPDPTYLHRMVFEEFAATYMDRNHLTEKFPDRFPGRWDAAAQSVVYAEVIPRATAPIDLVRNYPREFFGNVFYNISQTFTRVLPAMFLALDRRILMFAAFVLYCLSFGFWREGRFGIVMPAKDPQDIRVVLIVWALATSLIIPVVVLLHVSARQYIQLVPVLILLGTLALRWLVKTRVPLAWLPR